MTKENQTPCEIDLRKLAVGEVFDIDIDDKVEDWVKVLLNKIETQKDGRRAPSDEAHWFKFSGSIEHKKHPQYQNAFILSGDLQTSYHAICVNSLESMVESLEIEIDYCFLDESYVKDTSLQDEIEISLGEDVYDLYFYKKLNMDLSEVLMDAFVLNKNHLPKINEFDEKKYWQE